MLVASALLCSLAIAPALAQPASQSVSLVGVLGGKALLVVNGSAPKAIAVGESHQGVKLLQTQGDQAVVEIGGTRQTLRLGDVPVSAGGGAPGPTSGGRIVMHAGSGGHFMSQGLINGRPVTMMVDTGATAVALSAVDADRIGLNYQSARRVPISTANGNSYGWLVKLSSVRLGDVDVFDVDALVTPAPMPFVLLGNSFLTRFQMNRTNDQLVLVKRY